MTTDFINNIILKYLYRNDKVNVNKLRCKKYHNIRNYLFSYFNDNPSTFTEILFRIKYNIERNYCSICSKPTYFKGISWYKKTGKLYADFCSCKCSMNSNKTKEAYKKSCIDKYGVDNPMKNKNVVDKGKETCKNKYGVVRASLLKEYQDKVKETNMKRYGVEVPLQNKEINKKWHETCYMNFGTYSPLANKEIYDKTEETTYKKYGVYCVFNTKENREKLLSEKTKQKRYETLRRNHTFNTSKIEETIYEKLIDIYGKNDVLREYKDKDRYPYRCDFYIKSLDLFIEVQGYYTHGKEPYNPNSIKHQILVQKYKERYGPNCQAITIWTIKDVEKRNKAKENNLKYLEIFHKDILKIKQDITILNLIINNFLKDYDN